MVVRETNMNARQLLLGLATMVAVSLPVRASLVLEYIQVNSINASLSNGPALTSLVMTSGQSYFLQVVLRDTLGSGPEFGQPSTVPWNTNGGLAGPGSLGLGFFFVQIDAVPFVAVVPNSFLGNAQLISATYGSISGGSGPPVLTQIGGIVNAGYEPGDVPDPTHQNRIGLFNFRINALANGSGTFHLRDPNPLSAQVDNALLIDADLNLDPNPGTLQPIDTLLFSDTGTFPTTKTYDLPITVVPEPSSMMLASMAAVGFGWRKLRRKTTTTRSNTIGH